MKAEILIGTIILVIAIISSGVVSDIFDLHWFLSWLFCVNVLSFFVYGYDKSQAIAGRYRIPNDVLIAMAVLGGAIGSIGGMFTFRHKTLMDRFQYYLYFILSLQALAFYLFF